jgi:predicted aspartyl protease
MPVYNHLFLLDSKIHPDPLKNQGPILNVEVSLPQRIAEIYDKKGTTVPAPRTGLALFDTGASNTCVDQQIIGSLGIPSIGIQTVHTPSGSCQQNRYPAKISFPGTSLPAVEFGSVYGATLHSQGIIALIGRDLLSMFVFTYNGPGGFITLAY